jgi:hypothetical protein
MTRRDIERRLDELEGDGGLDELSLCMVLSEPDRYEDAEGYDHVLRDTRTGEVGRVPWANKLTDNDEETTA